MTCVNSHPRQLLILAPTGDEAQTIANSLNLRRKQKHHWSGVITDHELHLIQTGMGTHCALAAQAYVTETKATPDAVLLAGYAAGLAAHMHVGDAILAEHVYDDGRLLSLPGKHKVMSLSFPRVTLACVNKVITSPTDKKSLHDSTGAACADMESGPLLQWCQQEEIPLTILRIISDATDDVMPIWLADCVDEQGDVRLLHAIKALALRPDRWTAMTQIIRKVAKARKRLAEAVQIIAPMLANSSSHA